MAYAGCYEPSKSDAKPKQTGTMGLPRDPKPSLSAKPDIPGSSQELEVVQLTNSPRTSASCPPPTKDERSTAKAGCNQPPKSDANPRKMGAADNPPDPEPDPDPDTNAKPNLPGSSQESEVVQLTNKARASAGCPPLTIDATLLAAARSMSADMAARGYFSHTTPDGMDFGTRIRKAGIRGAAAENIAKGQRTPVEVVDSWLGSSGHRANMLNCSLIRIGVGVVPDSTGTLLWTQIFAS